MTSPFESLAIAAQHQRAGRLSLAAQVCRRILATDPQQPDAWHRLGLVALQAGDSAMAIRCLESAVNLKAADAEAQHSLARAYHQAQRIPDAIARYREALRLRPDSADMHNNCGNALTAAGDLDAAIGEFQCALRLRPDFAEAHSNLGCAWARRGDAGAATIAFQHAVRLKPDFAEGHYNLGLARAESGQFDAAIDAFQETLRRKPDFAAAHNDLGNARRNTGQVDEAVACFERAVALNPRNIWFHSNLLFTLHFRPRADSREILEHGRRWDQVHAKPLSEPTLPHDAERDEPRRLRIGYVSPNFRDHCQAFFTTPLFAAHDHRAFEIHAYSDVVRPDAVTAGLRALVDVWRDIGGLSDEQVAALIRRDHIDILVDLTMHMAKHRLLVFARRPAPVQVCWLAYPGTTGVSAIQYRLTDPHLDPPGCHDQDYSEESIRLPDSFWCYDPLCAEPAVSESPARQRGYATFACLNNYCKVNAAALRVWARALKLVERSRLLLLAPPGRPREAALRPLQDEGIAAERIEFVDRCPRPQYLALYQRVDVALDTFPCNGHTTSLDALWMGVPVVTLVGPTVVGRAGLSQLTNLGLPEFIARTPAEFVEIAADWAGDPSRLARLRAELRARLRASALMDGRRFARGVEAAYREMWRRWFDAPARHR